MIHNTKKYMNIKLIIVIENSVTLRNTDSICHWGISWQTCVRDNIWHCGIRITFAFVEYHVRHACGITFGIAEYGLHLSLSNFMPDMSEG